MWVLLTPSNSGVPLGQLGIRLKLPLRKLTETGTCWDFKTPGPVAQAPNGSRSTCPVKQLSHTLGRLISSLAVPVLLRFCVQKTNRYRATGGFPNRTTTELL